jgi:hypothetical protein
VQTIRVVGEGVGQHQPFDQIGPVERQGQRDSAAIIL